MYDPNNGYERDEQFDEQSISDSVARHVESPYNLLNVKFVESLFLKMQSFVKNVEKELIKKANEKITYRITTDWCYSFGELYRRN